MYYWDRLPTQASEPVAMGLAGQSSAVGPLLVRPFAKKLTPSLSTAVPCSWPMISQRHCRSGGETPQGHAERTDSRGSGGTAHPPRFASAYAPPSGHLPELKALPSAPGREVGVRAAMLVALPEQVSHNRSLASSAIDRALPLDA